MSNHLLLPRQVFILTIFLVDLDSARPTRARMHSRLVPIFSSFSSFDLSIASVTRESTIPRLREVNGGSDSRRHRLSTVRSTGKVGHGNCNFTPSGAIPVSTRRRCATQSVCSLFRSGVGKLTSEFDFRKCSTRTQSRGGGGGRGECVLTLKRNNHEACTLGVDTVLIYVVHHAFRTYLQ